MDPTSKDSASAPSPERWTASDIARWPHTALLVALIVAVASTGAVALRPTSAVAGASTTASPIVHVYLPGLLVGWGLVLYVSRVGRARSALAFLIGRGWSTVARACGDLALAGLGWLIIEASELAFARIGRVDTSDAVRAMLPSTALERCIWVAFAVSAGFCEEVVYRGYLEKQLAAFTRRPAWGVALQAVLFGLAHLEQGPATAARLAVYAVGLGVLAYARRSLWPGIVCHVAIDVTSGLLRA
jgi:membrane protease YdiL (CAAX protease family)